MFFSDFLGPGASKGEPQEKDMSKDDGENVKPEHRQSKMEAKLISGVTVYYTVRSANLNNIEYILN